MSESHNDSSYSLNVRNLLLQELYSDNQEVIESIKEHPEQIEETEVKDVPLLDDETYRSTAQWPHVTERVKRSFPMSFSSFKRLKFPFMGIYIIPNNRVVYLANVYDYWNAYPLFFYSIYKILAPQILEFGLLATSLFTLKQIGDFFNLFTHFYVSYFFRFLLGLCIIYGAICLKLLPTKILFYYMSHLNDFPEQNAIHLNLLKTMVSRYEKQTSSKDPTTYYKQLRAFSQLIDFDDFKLGRLNLLLEHKVDWRKDVALESSSLIWEGQKSDAEKDPAKLFLYFKYLTELDSEQLDVISCRFVLKHLEQVKEKYSLTSFSSVLRACLQYYPQLEEHEKTLLMNYYNECLDEKNQNDSELIEQLLREDS